MPLVVRYDGVAQAAATSSRLVANIDLAPTFAAAGGRRGARRGGPELPEPPPQPERRWRPDVLVENRKSATAPQVPSYCVVRNATHSYVQYGTGEEEIYDMSADPGQLQNLARARPPQAPGHVPAAHAGALQPAPAGHDAAQRLPDPRQRARQPPARDDRLRLRVRQRRRGPRRGALGRRPRLRRPRQRPPLRRGRPRPHLRRPRARPDVRRDRARRRLRRRRASRRRRLRRRPRHRLRRPRRRVSGCERIRRG